MMNGLPLSRCYRTSRVAFLGKRLVADFNEFGLFLGIAGLLSVLLRLGLKTVRTALELLHQLFYDRFPRLLARRITPDRDLHLVLAGVILVLDLRRFGHAGVLGLLISRSRSSL